MPPRLTLTNGPALPAAVAVDRLGDQLLAGAALAGDQHRRVGRRDAADDLEDAQQARDPRRRERRSRTARRAPRGRERGARGRRLGARDPSTVRTVCSICWLVQGLVMKSEAPAFIPATARAIDPHAVISTTGSSGRSALMLAEQLQPLLARRPAGEVHVLEHELAASRARATRAPRPATLGVRGVAGLLQQQRQRRGHRGVVVDDQNHAGSGPGVQGSTRPTRSAAPRPGETLVAIRLGYQAQARVRR